MSNDNGISIGGLHRNNNNNNQQNNNNNNNNLNNSLEDKTFTFIKHSDLNLDLTIKLLNLEGFINPFQSNNNNPTSFINNNSLFIELSLWSNNKSITNLVKIKSSYKSFKSNNTSTTGGTNNQNSYNFNEFITLPIKYKDLSLNSSLVLTIYSHTPTSSPSSFSSSYHQDHTRIIGGSTLKLFGKKSTLKKGQQRLFIWKGIKGDGFINSETPSKLVGGSNSTKDERSRLEKLVKKRENGDLIRMDWLDKLTFRQSEKIHAAESATSENIFFYIDLPRFDFPVVFSELEYPLPILPSLTTTSSTLTSSPSTTTTTTSLHSTSIPSSNHLLGTTTTTTLAPPSFPSIISRDSVPLFGILDPEMARDNPVEGKHRRLVRSHRNGPLDRELKPNAKIRDELNEILRYPPTQTLTPLQKDLIWQFRFYLTRDPRGLTKFLKSVSWNDPMEVKQAIENLVPLWFPGGLAGGGGGGGGEIEMEDALELLGPGEGFRDRRVRGYAVGLLAKADDEELMLYLLQLVQALKFETPQSSSTSSSNQPHPSPSTSTSLRTSRHSTSKFPSTPSTPNNPTSQSFESSISNSTFQNSSSITSTYNRDTNSNSNRIKGLEEFLIERSARNPVLGNHFRWYIFVEMEDKILGKLYEGVARRFDRKIAELQVEGEPDRLELLRRQSKFITRISSLALEIRNSRDPRPKKVERLRLALSDPKSPLTSFPPFPLPLDAKKLVIGIDAEKSSVFKSNLFPLRLHLLCSDGTDYPIIFKNGDDLRQDQLVIQLFTLMDKLLRKENLDLKLMPYRVLATGAVDGMVQFVNSKTLQDISNAYQGGLLGYLKEGNEDPGSVGTYGIKPEVLDTYIRSCAGYCVVTYLLGVGDRHLDNLLLSPDGHFFHVDFGYILGRDPKPFPPSIKVCKEMVDAMGGLNSPHYARFKNLCYTGFTTLRKNANLIINLVALMVDGNIPDIKLEPDKAVMKVQDKFLLNLSEEEAIKAFESLLNENSYFASVLDRIHSVAQYWRS